MRTCCQFLFGLFFYFFLPCLQAQEADPRIAVTKIPLPEVELLLMPSVDNAALQQAEMERRVPGVAPRFAETFPVSVTPATHGRWEEISNGEVVWRLRILSKGAYSLNLGFTRFRMPRGSHLILYSFDQQRVMGPFSPADNEEHAQLWTPVFAGDALVLEVRLPKARRADLELELGYINHDFLNFSKLLSGGCNLDVACGSKDGWEVVDRYRDIIQSVGMFGFSGNSFCTGFLVNNTRNDCTPYFMTANHCGVDADNAASVVVYWNFQNSYCRQPNSSASNRQGDGDFNTFSSGAIFRAGFADSDFTLMELDDPLPLAANAFMAGWSASEETPSDTTICIHHPNSNEKRISFNFDPVKVGLWGNGGQPVADGNHLIVNNWEVGTTEIGSSGGPLFNRRRQVIGQLHGGLASCNTQFYDQFGWFHTSWEGGGTKATSLRPWLDPDGLGITALDGRWQSECGGALEVTSPRQSICSPAPVRYQIMISDQFTAAVTLSVEGIPAGASGFFSRNPVLPGESTTLAISNTGVAAAGNYEITVTANDGTAVFRSLLELTIFRERPAPIVPLTPTDQEQDINPLADFTWEAQPVGTLYELVVAADPQFVAPVATFDNLTTPAFRGLPLDEKTTYYWRVRGHNDCGAGDWSDQQMFTTADIQCTNLTATDLPLEIPLRNTSVLTSTIDVPIEGKILGVEISNLDIIHSFVGDLRVRLTSPGGTSIILFDRLGWPGNFYGCEGDNLVLAFSDTAALSPQQLENTCNQRPAALGFFRPVQAFSAFTGEPAQGPWVLTVEDVNLDDGGKFNDWSLDLCVARSRDFSLKPTATSFKACPGRPFSFDLSIGEDFQENGVTLGAAGLPPGAVLQFSQNPAPPGATIRATVEGLAAGSSFPLVITGTDGIMTTITNLDLEVVGPPAAALPFEPAEGTRDVSTSSVMLRWRSAANAASYRIQVAINKDFGAPILNDIVTDTAFLLSGLQFQTTYYWKVEAQNVCGQTAPDSAVQFTTVSDISFLLSTDLVKTCRTAKPVFNLTVGTGFESPRLQYSVSPEAPFQLDFSADTTALPRGELVTVTVNELEKAAPGDYRIDLTVKDDNHAVSRALTLRVLPEPPLVPLLAPANKEILGTPQPTLVWGAGPDDATYRLEIATDDLFLSPVQEEWLTDTLYILVEPLAPGSYYWRVTAGNECGGSTSAAHSFTIQTTAAGHVFPEKVLIYPNPGRDQLFLQFPTAPPADLSLELYSPEGRWLQVLPVIINNGSVLQIDLSVYPSGVYLLRFQSSKGVATRRIVLQR